MSSDSESFSIHLVQWQILPGETGKNLETAALLIRGLEPDPGDLVLLPEMFSSGFHYPELANHADRSDEIKKWMSNISSEFSVALAGSLPIKNDRGIANSLVFMDESGNQIGSYEKIHLFPVMDEDKVFVPGNHPVVLDWKGVPIGLLICFDLRFPELTRELCMMGARMVIVSAQWPQARVDHFRDFVKVRAMENQYYVAAVNSCGSDGNDTVMGGNSLMVDPWGNLVGELGDEAGVCSVLIDLGEVSRAREGFPVLSSRRNDSF